MKPTKKNPLRRTEVFTNQDTKHDATVTDGWWKPIKFTKLKAGDIFRCFDTGDDGNEKPDQVDRKGNHIINVALEDAVEKPMPMLGVVKCLPVRGFTKHKEE